MRTRDRVASLEAVMIGMAQAVLTTAHHFSEGVYVRELRIPAGATAVGKIHKTRHLLIMASGDMLVVTDDEPKRLTGFNIIETQPGEKRAVHALQDTVLVTVHVTDETDLNLIEERVIAKSFDEIEAAHQPVHEIEVAA